MNEPADTLPPGPPPNFKFPDNPDAYLGNPEVVEALVRGFVSSVARARTEEQFMAVVNSTADIFCGANPDYEVIAGWHDRLHLGMEICSRIGVDPNQDWQTIMRTALMKAALEVRGWAVQHQDDPDEAWQWKVDGLIEFWTSLVVGTASLTHPLSDPAD